MYKVVSLILCGFVATSIAGDIVIKPLKPGPTEVGLVMIQGAQLPAERYTPLASAIQNTSKYPIWVGIPEFVGSTPEPLEIGNAVSRIVKAMRDGGMSSSAKILFTAHSLGGIILQDHLNSTASGALGLVLMGSFLQKKYHNTSFAVPTMTIGGELDGLCRCTRIMDEYYHYVLHASNQDYALANFPVVLVNGLSHLQFASGSPPELVKIRDLKPEISNYQAHREIAMLVSSFLSVRLGDSSSLQYITNAVQTTGAFFKPLIAAYELEGYYNFVSPCYLGLYGPCTLGSPWSERAQQVMGGLPMGTVNDTDVFHPVYQINPVHLPHVLNSENCSLPSASCIVNMTTVSQNVYDTVNSLIDAGFVTTSASEIRVKLKSRQVVLEAAGYKNTDFNKTDGSSICKVINQKAYEWAMQNSHMVTLARFNKWGVSMVMGEDKGPYNVGPIWIWDPLSYKETQSPSGEAVIEVRSVMMRTPKNYSIEAAAGMHYCKLLSPARAIEWMYVDGLREHYGINN